MTGKKPESNDDVWVGVAVLIVAGLAIALAWAKLPQVFMVLPGMFVGAGLTFVASLTGPETRRYGVKLIATGLLVGTLFFLIDSHIGADAQNRRLIRGLHDGATVEAITAHPWAVIPLGSAFLALGAGGMLVWNPS